jgi:hypothetical protein
MSSPEQEADDAGAAKPRLPGAWTRSQSSL